MMKLLSQGSFPLNGLKSRLLTVLFFLLCAPVVLSAQKFTIDGSIKDARNGEDLIGATVRVKESSTLGARSNSYGFYSLTLPKGNYTLIYQYLGYEKQEITVEVDKNSKRDIQLIPVEKTIKDVVIKAVKEDKNITRTEMGVVRLDPKAIETVPVLFGEKDILKTLQLTPGVKAAGEGQSGFYVRGGGVDQKPHPP